MRKSPALDAVISVKQICCSLPGYRGILAQAASSVVTLCSEDVDSNVSSTVGVLQGSGIAVHMQTGLVD